MRMKINARRPYCQTTRSFFLVLLLCVSVYGQIRDERIFKPVPAPLRPRLIERLNLLVVSQRSEKWDKQYDLLSVLVTQGESKENYMKRLSRWYADGLGDVLVDFTPKSVTYQGGGPADVVIFGCARLRSKDRFEELDALVDAYRENGDWYFSTIGVITPVDGKAQPCEPKKRSC